MAILCSWQRQRHRSTQGRTDIYVRLEWFTKIKRGANTKSISVNVGALNRLRALKASSWTERQGVTMPHTGASALPKRCRRAPIARFMQVALATPASGARIRNTCTTASAGQVVWGPGWRNTCPGSTAGNAGRRSPAATRSTKSPAAPRANVQKLE